MEQRERESEPRMQAVSYMVILLGYYLRETNGRGEERAILGPQLLAAFCLIQDFANALRTARIVTTRKEACVSTRIAARKH